MLTEGMLRRCLTGGPNAKDRSREKEEQLEKVRKEMSWYRGNNIDKWNIFAIIKFSNKAVRVYDNLAILRYRFKVTFRDCINQRTTFFSGIPDVCRTCPYLPLSPLCYRMTLNLWPKHCSTDCDLNCSVCYSCLSSTSRLRLICAPHAICPSSVHLTNIPGTSCFLYPPTARCNYTWKRLWSWSSGPIMANQSLTHSSEFGDDSD